MVKPCIVTYYYLLTATAGRMRIKHIFLTTGLLISSFFAFCTMASTTQVMEQMPSQNYPNNLVGALFQEADSEKVLFQHLPNKMLSPASNMKVFLAVAAWFELGKNFQFKTTLYRANNLLYIKFSGDPSLTQEDLEALLRSIKFKPKTVIINTSDYQAPNHPAGITFDDLGWYYEAPSTAAIINQNAVEMYLHSSKTLGGPVSLSLKQKQSPLKLVNELKTVSWDEARKNCDMYVENLGHNHVRLYGCLAKRKKKKRINLAIPNPVLYAQSIIKQSLSSKHFRGSIIEGKVPSNAKLIAQHGSEKLPELLEYMLQKSDNLYADSFTKQLGLHMFGQGNFIQGAKAIKKSLAKHTDIDVKKLKIRDGQGSRYNLVTAAQMNKLLTTIWQNPGLKSLMLKALPTFGKTGTVADRLKNSKLSGHITAKTGSMHDTSSLAGFILTPNTKPIIFSIMINNFKGNVYNTKAFEDKLLSEFYNQTTAKT